MLKVVSRIHAEHRVILTEGDYADSLENSRVNEKKPFDVSSQIRRDTKPLYNDGDNNYHHA